MANTHNHQRLVEACEAIAHLSGGRITIVGKQAPRHLELDEKRLGRDIEEYGSLGDEQGWESLLPLFLKEVLLPLKEMCFFSPYHVGKEELKDWGRTVFSGSAYEEFLTLL